MPKEKKDNGFIRLIMLKPLPLELILNLSAISIKAYGFLCGRLDFLKLSILRSPKAGEKEFCVDISHTC